MSPDDLDELLSAIEALRTRVAAVERKLALLAEDSDFDDDPEFEVADLDD